jgi:hypothetical protein
MKYEQKNQPDILPEDLKEIYINTEGACGSPDPFECYMLNKLAKEVKGNAIEFGSWRGRSSCFIAKGLKGTLYCVDHLKDLTSITIFYMILICLESTTLRTLTWCFTMQTTTLNQL